MGTKFFQKIGRIFFTYDAGIESLLPDICVYLLCYSKYLDKTTLPIRQYLGLIFFRKNLVLV